RVQMGINREDFLARTGFILDELATPAILKHVSSGLITDDGTTIRLTRSGVMLGDTVAADFLD
ncbi:MAG: coproporphyrinogen III oxidase, partial [Planctomycetota bacterium]|nr:coproporphyrinogen III oxidase [Planctomycetota bacterium]